MKKFVIIAVDDNVSYLDSLKQFFSKYKDRYDLPASNCISKFVDEYNVEFLLDKIKNVKPDVILMDFSFDMTGKPNDYGIELVRRIKTKFPDQPIIMLVGDEENEGRAKWEKIDRSFEAGASAYIGKKEVSSCMEAIDEVVKGDIYVSKSTLTAFMEWQKTKRPPSKYKLTSRQREVLQLLSQDLSIGEAADRMIGENGEPLTQHVVNFHLKNIKQRLNTRTIHGTIAKGVLEKLI